MMPFTYLIQPMKKACYQCQICGTKKCRCLGQLKNLFLTFQCCLSGTKNLSILLVDCMGCHDASQQPIHLASKIGKFPVTTMQNQTILMPWLSNKIVPYFLCYIGGTGNLSILLVDRMGCMMPLSNLFIQQIKQTRSQCQLCGTKKCRCLGQLKNLFLTFQCCIGGTKNLSILLIDRMGCMMPLSNLFIQQVKQASFQ